MADLIKLKSGETVTVLSISDVLECIDKEMGMETSNYVQSYVNEVEWAMEDLQYDMEDAAKNTEWYQDWLSGRDERLKKIKDTVKELETLLEAKRIGKRELGKIIDKIKEVFG